MINFLKTKIALLWAKKHTQNAEIYKQNAAADQEKLLFSLLKTAENTLFGKGFKTLYRANKKRRKRYSMDFSARIFC